VWRYPKELRNAAEHAYDDARHGEPRAALTAELLRVMHEAYAALDAPRFADPS
jgi:HD-like signal output (HDOD) protein